MRKIGKAITYARFDGWTIGIFGAITFLGGLLSWIGFVMGAAMCAIAYIELRGARRLKQLDASATKTLALNQVALAMLLITYAVYSLWGVYHGPSAIGKELAAYPELSQMAGNMEELSHQLALLIYGLLIAVAIFGQGATAIFYRSRRRYIEAYLRETPGWIVDAQRAGI